MNAKIRHCAIWSDGCERSARFYETIFGMRFFTNPGVAERDPSNRTRGQLSDGVIGLALNPRPPGYRSGLDHFGFQLHDLGKVSERIKQDYPETIFTKGLEGVAFAGLRITDPVGTHIDIAQERGANLRGGYKDEGWEQPRHLHHIAIRAKKPVLLAEFYRNVFELTSVKNLSGEGEVCLTDGKSYLLIRPCENYSYRSMTEGIDHVGFIGRRPRSGEKGTGRPRKIISRVGSKENICGQKRSHAPEGYRLLQLGTLRDCRSGRRLDRSYDVKKYRIV